MSSRGKQLMRSCWQVMAVHFGHKKFNRILKIKQLLDRSETGPAITLCETFSTGSLIRSGVPNTQVQLSFYT